MLVVENCFPVIGYSKLMGHKNPFKNLNIITNWTATEMIKTYSIKITINTKTLSKME